VDVVLQLSFIFLIIIFIFLDISSLYSSRRSYTLLSTLYRKTFLINLANDFQSAEKHRVGMADYYKENNNEMLVYTRIDLTMDK
jgi:hypothetical protein